MSNLHQLSAIAKQRKKRTLWRNLVVCFAALVVFCTTYALILPAITMEQEGYSCGLQEHTHTPDCYRLTCGKQEAYTHTHTKPDCYDANGNLTCPLKEQTLHRHTQDCYSKSQPVCGLAEAAPHAHEDACYTEGELTCTLAETQGHTHGQDCYPVEFTPELICGQQELPEHRHTAACYTLTCQQQEHTHTESCISSHQAFLNSIQEATQEATQPEAVTEPQEATQPEEATLPEEVTLPEEATQPEEVTQPEDVTQPEEATEPQEPTQPETVTEPQEPTQEEEPKAPVMLLASPMRGTGSGAPERMKDVATFVSVKGQVKDENGNWVDGAEYNKDKNGFDMNLRIEFKFSVEKDEAGRGYICTTDSEGNKIPHGTEYLLSLKGVSLDKNLPTEWQTVMDTLNPNKQAFQFQFAPNANGDAELHVKFFDDYIRDAGNQIDCFVNASGWMSADKADDNGNIHYPVDDGITLDVSSDKIKYKENESLHGDLTVGKYGFCTYDATSKRLSYTVTVSTANGTPGSVNIKDVLTKKGLAISGAPDVSVKDNQGNTLTNGDGGFSYTHTSATDTETLDMNLPQLQKGKQYTITYTYTLDNAPESPTTVDNKVEGSSQKDGTTVKHEATYRVDVPKDTPTEPTDPTDPPVHDPQIVKNAKLSEDKQTIQWEIIVNDYNFVDLVPLTLTDDMLPRRITADGSNGLQVILGWGSDPLSPEDCNKHFEITDNTIKFKPVDAQGNESTDGKNMNRYTIRYSTPVGDIGNWGNHAVRNEVTVGPKTTSAEVSQDGGKVEKAHGTISLDENGLYHINWTTTVTLAKDGFVLDESLTDDTMPDGENGSGKHYFDQSSIHLFYDNVELDANTFQVTFFDKKGGTAVTASQDATYMELRLRQNPAQGPDSVADKQLRLEYTTYARKSEMAGSIDGQNKVHYRNKVDYRKKTDTRDADVIVPSLTKFDGKDQTGTTSVENFNGELDWKVNVTLGSVSSATYVEIVDKLPENVDVHKLSMQALTPGTGITTAELVVDGSGNISGGDGYYAYSGTCTKEGENTFYTVRVKATRHNEAEAIEPSTAFVLSLNCKINDAYFNANETGTFINHADGKTNEGEITGSQQTQNWTKVAENPREGAMSKGMASRENTNRELSYTVQINPKGADIQPGSSKVYVTDEFEYSPQRGRYDLVYNLLSDSVKLYEATLVDGKMEKGRELSSNEWRWTMDEDDPGEAFTYANVTKYIRMEVPDSTPLILEYKYYLTSFNPTVTNVWDAEIKNRAYFTAYPDETVEDGTTKVSFQNLENSGGAQTSGSLVITKTKEGDSQTAISGAKFMVYKAVRENDSWIWQGPISLGEDTNPKVYTTSNTGVLLAKKDDGYETNVLYKLVETASGDGYIIADPQNPPSVKFYFSSSSDTAHTLPEEESFIMQDAKDLTNQGVFEKITNPSGTADFSVEKVWRDHNNQVVTGTQTQYSKIDLKLIQVATEVRQDASVYDPLLSTSKVVIGYGKYGIDKTETITVPKGAVITITVRNCASGAAAKQWIPPGGNFNSGSIPISPKSVNGTTYVYSFTVKHDIGFGITTNNNDQAPAVEYDYTGHSTGDTGSGETTPLVVKPKEVATITLDANGQWKWHSKDNPGLVPVRGTVKDSTGADRDVWFSYYVDEVPGNYTTTMSNQDGQNKIAITSGTITVTNTLPPPPADVSVTVKKTWAGLGNWDDLATVNCELFQKTWASEAEFQAAQENAPLNYGVTYDMTEEQIAALANGTLKRVQKFTLNSGDNWTWSMSNLPGGANGQYYTYFVVEEPGDYTVTYTPQVHEGTITVTNTTEKKPTEIQVNKQWFNHLGESTVAPTGTDSVDFTLYRIAQVGDTSEAPTTVGTYQVTSVGNWTWNSTTAGLKLLAMEYKEGQTYTYSYYVQEIVPDPENAGYKATYGIVDDMAGESPTVIIKDELTPIQSGTLVIRNTLDSPKYQLPQTGGTGTAPLRLAGLTLALTAACLLHRKRKTRPQ